MSGTSDDRYSVASTGPVTSTSSSRGSVVYTRTSGRHSACCWSRGPIDTGVTSSEQQVLPPMVITGCCGSYLKLSRGSSCGASTLRPPSPNEEFALPPPCR